jgi:hypothetical protein
VLGKHSGRHAVETRLSELGYALSQEELNDLFDRFKVLADKKQNINDMDLLALVSHKIVQAQGVYALDRFTVNSGNYVSSSAVVRLKRGDELIEEVCLGDGPIDAAFNAVDRSCGSTSPTSWTTTPSTPCPKAKTPRARRWCASSAATAPWWAGGSPPTSSRPPFWPMWRA